MLLALALMFQQVPVPTPVASVTIRPADAAVTVGDTLRLTAQAFDSAGRPLADVRTRWFLSGLQFEGTVDSTGLVTAGAVGALRVTVLASPQGGAGPRRRLRSSPSAGAGGQHRGAAGAGPVVCGPGGRGHVHRHLRRATRGTIRSAWSSDQPGWWRSRAPGS
ncbi:MAG: Ig-like domain-containing protein [Gemmatimonadales bacterium]